MPVEPAIISPQVAQDHQTDGDARMDRHAKTTQESSGPQKPEQIKKQHSTHKYRDPEKWRAYMRSYMAKRRGGKS